MQISNKPMCTTEELFSITEITNGHGGGRGCYNNQIKYFLIKPNKPKSMISNPLGKYFRKFLNSQFLIFLNTPLFHISDEENQAIDLQNKQL